MSQVERKWVADRAINNEKIDEADTYDVKGLLVDSTTATGGIGIGTTDPLDPLHIRRSDTSAGLRLDLADGAGGRVYKIYSQSTGLLNIQYATAPVADRLTIDGANGFIGINTTAPLDNLHVQSTSSIAGIQLDLNDGVTGRAYQLGSDNAGGFIIKDVDAALTRLTIDSAGSLHIENDATILGNFQVEGDVVVINTEIVIADQLEINQTSLTQSALIASQDTPGATGTVVRIENAGSGAALTTDNGFVGIGTAVPLSSLHVEGDIVGKLTASPSNIGSTTRRIGNLYMASNVDYLTDLAFNSGGTRVTFTTAGSVGIGSTIPDAPLTVIGNIRGSAGITAGTGITATTGNIVATVGAVNAGTTVTAGTGDVTATLGAIRGVTCGIGTVPATVSHVYGSSPVLRIQSAPATNTELQLYRSALNMAKFTATATEVSIGSVASANTLIISGNTTAIEINGGTQDAKFTGIVGIGTDPIASYQLTGYHASNSKIAARTVQADSNMAGMYNMYGGLVAGIFETERTAGVYTTKVGGDQGNVRVMAHGSTVIYGDSTSVSVPSGYNVGIGTTVPAELFQIYGSSPVLRVQSAPATNTELQLYRSALNMARFTATATEVSVGSVASANTLIISGNTTAIEINGGTQDAKFTGIVGIGTDPIAGYQFTGYHASSSKIAARTVQADGNVAGLYTMYGGGTVGIFESNRTTGVYTTDIGANDGNVRLYAGGAAVLQAITTGQIGIGNTTPAVGTSVSIVPGSISDNIALNVENTNILATNYGIKSTCDGVASGGTNYGGWFLSSGATGAFSVQVGCYADVGGGAATSRPFEDGFGNYSSSGGWVSFSDPDRKTGIRDITQDDKDLIWNSLDGLNIKGYRFKSETIIGYDEENKMPHPKDDTIMIPTPIYDEDLSKYQEKYGLMSTELPNFLKEPDEKGISAKRMTDFLVAICQMQKERILDLELRVSALEKV